MEVEQTLKLSVVAVVTVTMATAAAVAAVAAVAAKKAKEKAVVETTVMRVALVGAADEMEMAVDRWLASPTLLHALTSIRTTRAVLCAHTVHAPSR